MSGLDGWFDTMRESAMGIMRRGQEPLPMAFIEAGTEAEPKAHVVSLVGAEPGRWQPAIREIAAQVGATAVAMVMTGWHRETAPEEVEALMRDGIRHDPRSTLVAFFWEVDRESARLWMAPFEQTEDGTVDRVLGDWTEHPVPGPCRYLEGVLP